MEKNQGFTLIELLVTIAILSIVLTGVATIMVTGSKSFAKGNADANMQSQAQLSVNQMEDMIIDTNGGIDYVDNGGSRECVLYNAFEAEDGSGTSYTKEAVKWVSAEQKLVYSKWNVNYDLSTGSYVVIEPAVFTEQLLAEDISDFSVDLSDTRKEYGKNGVELTIVQSVQITVGYIGNGGQVSYVTSPVITLRNRMMQSSSPEMIFDNTPVIDDTLKLYISGAAEGAAARIPIQDRVTEVERSQMYNIYAMINAENDVNSLVNWSIEEAGNTSTIDANGLLNVGESEPNQYLTIVATYKNNPGKYAKGVVKVAGADKTLDAVEIIPVSLAPFKPQYNSLVTTTGYTEEDLATDLEYIWSVSESSWATFENGKQTVELAVLQSEETYGKKLTVTLTVRSKSSHTSRSDSVIYNIPLAGDSGDSYLERGKENSMERYNFTPLNDCWTFERYEVTFCDEQGNALPELDDLLQYIYIRNPGNSGFGFDIKPGLPANRDYFVKVTIYNTNWNQSEHYVYNRILYISGVKLRGKNKQVQWKGLGRYTEGVDYAMSGYYSVTWQSERPYTMTVESIEYDAPEGVTVEAKLEASYMLGEGNLVRSEVTLSAPGYESNAAVLNQIRVKSLKVKISMTEYPDIFCYSTLTFTE